MDFAYDDRTEDPRERLLAFMDEQVYPAEPVFTEQAEAAEAAGLHLGTAARHRGAQGRGAPPRAVEPVPYPASRPRRSASGRPPPAGPSTFCPICC